MASNNGVSVQADIAAIPGAALNTVSFTQGLLRAVSADNVNPLAVVQMQAIGGCFQSNGPWAAKLPDLLSRTSCARLERLSTWIGWAKDDTSTFMSHTPGGRTAALLCTVLGSLYPKAQCGMTLFNISRHILPLELQRSSPTQLGDVCMVLEGKLGCLGFGNHLALQLTRLRQCFFEADLDIPRDLADTPTEEDMWSFLVRLRDALQDETQVLHFSGTKCSGTLLALVLAVCPEDVLLQVNGEVVMRGIRDNIMFSIINAQNRTARIHLETKLRTHTTGFRKSHIIVESRHQLNRQLNFSWDGILSSQLDIALTIVGAAPQESLKFAVANLIASMAMSFTRKDFNPTGTNLLPHRFPPRGLRTLLGPMYPKVVQDRLQRVLCRPSDLLKDPALEYETLCNVGSTALPYSYCTCGICASDRDPWNPLKRPKSNTNAHEKWISCPVSRLWSVTGHIVQVALLALFVQASPNSSARLQTDRHTHFVPEFCWRAFNRSSEYYALSVNQIDWGILDLVGRWKPVFGEDAPPKICSSSSASTIYPSTLESPSISNPWVVQYDLADGRLHYSSDCYDFIICAAPETRAIKQLARMKAKSSLQQGTIPPSGLGEHSSLLMTLRPALLEGRQALTLRCQIRQGNRTIDVNFADIHLGLMSLTPADSCTHALSTPFVLSDRAQPVKATSVIAPVASGLNAIGLTLTHRNEESQFLCCTAAVSQLYQGNCCMTCAVAQAELDGYKVVIGGSTTRYHVVDSIGVPGEGSK